MKSFKPNKLNSKGFGHLELLLVILTVIALAGVGYFVYQNNQNTAHAGSWQALVSGTNKETTATIYACVDKQSTSLWWVKGLGTLSPGVKDSSDYTAGITLGSSVKGGASTTNTWFNHSTAHIKAGFDPITSSPSVWAVTPILEYPQNDNPSKGGGGGAVYVIDLPSC